MPAALSGAVDLSGLKNKAEGSAGSQQGGSARSAGGSAGTGGGNVIEVTEADFQSAVVERSMQVPVVVDLWATWCGPCKQLSPLLERMAGEYGGAWVLAKVDVDANPRIAQLFGVQSVPTVVAIGGGQPVEAFSGAQPEPQIRQWLDSLLDQLRDQLPGIRAAEEGSGQEGAEEAEDPRFTEAEEALERGDYSGAESVYQRILEAEPENEQAKAALQQVRFTARAEQADPSAIERADSAPDDVDTQIAAADAELATQRPVDAFERMIATVKRTSGDERDRARQHLLSLFDLFPTDDQRVTAARRKLASALF